MGNQAKTTQTVSVREANARDIKAISDIYNYFVENSTATFATQAESLSEREAWFAHHSQEDLPVCVAVENGAVVSWASLSYYHQRCAYRQTVEISFYIHHEYVGCGIGKLLTEHLLKQAVDRNYHCVLSLVCSENEASLALLRKFDFEVVGQLREVGRKFDRWLDVTLMQKMLQS